jgi:iron complex outermembrane recepter protein
MKKKFILILRKSLFTSLFFVLIAGVYAQQIPVTFKVINQKKEPVVFATVTVVNRTDTLQEDKKISDSSGVVTFTLSKAGQYIVSISSVNYQPLEKGITVTANQNTFSFSLETLAKTLTGVVVTSSKPLMKQEDDKTIVDPENLVAASTNGYEVIEKTPGLFVDQDGNIYISSLTPASVQINGRDMKMSAADMATMLKSLPPNSILKIEIVRTPSAKYEASSTGGIVNVVLKKGVKIGMTGSVTAGMQQGVYGNQFIGFNLNNNNGKTSSYINLNYSRRNSYERIVTDRIFAPDSMLSQNAYTIYPSTNYFISYGIVYALNKKWDIDFAGSLMYQDFDNKTDNQSEISKISTSQSISDNLNKVSYRGNFVRVSNGINFRLKMDTVGSEWSNDFYYSYDRNRISQQYTTFLYTPVTAVFSGYGSPDNDRNFFTYTNDLKKKFKKRLTVETGFKSSFLSFKSNALYYVQSGPSFIKDNSRTSSFNYKENINAFYLQGSQTFGKDIVLKMGARLENTNMEGTQIIPDDTSFNIHRTDLFPYIYLSKNIMKIFGYGLRAYLVYRRTITRPVYEQLNPFPKYVDPYLSETGNPSLRPQFTQNYEANISVDERPVLAIGVNDTKDIFTNVIYQPDSSKSQAYRTYDNLGKNKEWYLRGLGALPPGGRYFLVIGGQYNHNFYQGLYENKPLLFRKGTWTFFTYQTFKIDKRSVITLNGFIRLKGQQQFYELTTFGALNTSVNRKFFKEKLIVTVSLNDMFATNKNNFTIKQGTVDASGYRKSDTRRFGINIRYSFGIRKKEENTNMFNAESPEKAN